MTTDSDSNSDLAKRVIKWGLPGAAVRADEKFNYDWLKDIQVGEFYDLAYLTQKEKKQIHSRASQMEIKMRSKELVNGDIRWTRIA